MIYKSPSSENLAKQTDTSGFGERSWAWFLCLVCLVVLFSNIGGGALFEPDEGRNAEKAREILLLDGWVTPYQNFLPTLDKPIPYYWLVVFSFYVAVQLDHSRSVKLYCLLMYAAMGAGTLVKGPVALVIPGIVIFCYLLLSRKWFLLSRMHILLGALVYFVVVAPWYLWVEA